MAKIVDRLLASVGLARAAQGRAGMQQRAFAAAQLSRLTESWLATRDEIHRELRSDLDKLRDRARQLEKDNDFARRYLELVETNVVGDTGIRLMSLCEDRPGVPDQLARDAIEAAWDRWGQLGVCEIGGSHSWLELCWSIARGTARDGEYMLQEVLGTAARNEFGYALRIIDVARIATWFERDAGPDGNAVRCGVEVDSDERPVAYWINRGRLYSRDAERVPAERIIHRFRGQWAGQPRGVPWMHASMLSLHYAGEFALSALLAAKYGADHLGFFITPDGDAPSIGANSTNDDGSKITTTAPGVWDTLPVGTDVRELASKYPSDTFDPFMKAAHRRLASGLNVSYPALCNDHADLNYNSIRATQADDRDQWRKYQAWFRDNWLEVIFPRWLKFALANEAIQMPNGSALPVAKGAKFAPHRWQFRGWASNDPMKDVDAAIAAINAGMDSRTAFVARAGRDVEDVIAELQREQELASAAKIAIGTGPKKTSPASSPAP